MCSPGSSQQGISKNRLRRYCTYKEIGTADVGVDGSVVDDAVTRVHVRQSVLGHVEEGVDVGGESELPLLLGEILDVLDHVLVGGVVDKNVDGPHLLESGIDDLLAVLLLLEVDLDQVALAAVCLNLLLGLLCVLLLDLEVSDQAVGALHGVEDGNSTTDAGVASGDDGLLALELAGGLVLLETTIAGGKVLVDSIGTLHVTLETRRLLVSDGDLEVCGWSDAVLARIMNKTRTLLELALVGFRHDD
jgi:hypothetical protein